MKNIYEKVIELNIEFSAYCSDLYIPVNETTIKLVNDYEFKSNVTKFKSNIDSKPWFDIPFAYQPYWTKRIGKK